MEIYKQTACHSYHQLSRVGTAIIAIISWRYRQSLTSQASNEKMQPSIGHDGNPTIHTRHFARENSDSRLYFIVIKHELPTPTKNLATANIIQLVEKNPARFEANNRTRATINGGFRPIRSPIWPDKRLPTNIPLTWIVITVLGM